VREKVNDKVVKKKKKKYTLAQGKSGQF